MFGIDFATLTPYLWGCLLLAGGMLLWDTIEVGRNDAANLVNAVFGARIMPRRFAIALAGVAVVAGAVLSSNVIDTARKGIFDPTGFGTLEAALAVYISVYIVDTVLLYGFSAFGIPVSTTACLVFELLGAALAINHQTVNWNKAGIVLAGIACSIVISGFVSFFIQRAARGAIRDRTTKLSTLLLHGGWLGGGLMAALCYFLLLKGMKSVGVVKSFLAVVKEFNEAIGADVGLMMTLLALWVFFAVIIHLLLVIYRQRAARLLFPTLAVLGMIAMSFAFGQNDLANCAAPGLAAFNLIQAGDLIEGTKQNINPWMLLVCGLFLFAGMTTKNAERVTKASVSTGSMGDHVALWAPRWCVTLAGRMLKYRGDAPALAPRAGITAGGKTKHYDSLRACVIMSVAAAVIATASSLGLPVSTTYVTFAAIMATGMADRIFSRGDADLKLGRTIWVITCWFGSAFIAAAAAGLVARIMLHLSLAGIVGCVLVNLCIRRYLKKRADKHDERVRDEAYERAHPEEFALEQEDA